MTHTTTAPRTLGGDFLLGGDLPVRRIGFGTMQLTGPGHWDHPADMDYAKNVLRRAVEVGVNHLDTADAYGPHVTENLIRKALHPYPTDLVIATKGGLTRQGPNRWTPVGRPEYLRQCVEMSLRRLAVERIDLYYLHRIDPAVPLSDQLGALADLQHAGKIRHLGLSNVTADQIRQAADIVTVAAVQNRFHLVADDDPALAFCESAGIAYVPYAPLAAGGLLWSRGSLDYFARAHGTTPAQLALGWLLTTSAVTLPIPGTSSISHLNDNLATDLDNVPSAALAAAVRAFRSSPRAASTVTGRP